MPAENLSEKVSVNINSSTLSSIDLLVDNGYYSNRSDFINQALRDALLKQQSTLDRIIEKHEASAQQSDNSWFIGLFGLTASEVNSLYNEGKSFSVTGYGVMILNSDVDEEKLFAIVKSISVKGKVICSQSIKAHYGLK